MASTVRTDKVGPVSGSADFTLPTSDGTAGQFLKTDGSLGLGFATVASTVYGLNSVQVFTATGTWTKPTGVTKVIVEVQAGGGGGGNNSGGYNGGSGGGGSYAQKFLDVTNIDTATVTVGAAGAVTVTGGTSSFAKLAGSGSFTTVECLGGSGGTNAASPTQGNGGYGGAVPTTGDINVGGGDGTYGGVGNGNRPGGSYMGVMCGFATGAAQAGRTSVGFGTGGMAGHSGAGAAGGVGIVYVREFK